MRCPVCSEVLIKNGKTFFCKKCVILVSGSDVYAQNVTGEAVYLGELKKGKVIRA